MLGWGEAPDSNMKLSPSLVPVGNATRLAVTPLAPDAVARIVAAGGRILATPLGDPISVNVGGALANPAAAAELLSFVLNRPRLANTYVYCRAADKVVPIAPLSQMDEAALDTMLCALIPKPVPSQQCTSRLVCFWCGASPVYAGVTLSLCAGCECVAYISEACAKSDWMVEHSMECGRTAPGKAQCPASQSSPLISWPSPERPRRCPARRPATGCQSPCWTADRRRPPAQ